MVYYRKYRPQTIGQLDNKKVRETLYSVLKGVASSTPTPVSLRSQANSEAKVSSVPHAFLFTGPKGLGKTSAARIVAKVVNCEHTDRHSGKRVKTSASRISKKLQRDSGVVDYAPPQNDGGGIEPDNTCEQCISITNGTNVDVLEIDGASNRGIDEIRDLREKVKLAPTAAKEKVYIIDEVHMLTTEAFNALLKTIEEPPAHVMFIFCTTEPHKVPTTIMSRCFHVAFSLASTGEIVHSLERIVAKEKIKISPELLGEIAKMAEGGFRDASKILEELVMLCGKDLKLEHFQSSFHTKSIFASVIGLLENLARKKTQESLKIVADLVTNGIDIKFFIFQVLSSLHRMLLEKTQVEKEITAFTKDFNLDDLMLLNDLFANVYQETKSAVIAQLPLEIAIIQYTSSRHSELGSGSSNILQEERFKPTIDSLKKKQQADKVQAIIHGTSRALPVTKAIVDKELKMSKVTQHDMHANPDEKTALMENIIYKVKPFNHSIAGVLRGCRIKNFDSNAIVFETAYKFHKERLEDGKSFEIIERAIKEITGKNIKVEVVLKN